MLKLIRKGLNREQAYALVQEAAFRTLHGKKDFQSILLQDRSIRPYLSPKEIHECFDLSHSLRHVDEIFRRVFRGKTLSRRERRERRGARS
jgi:adenylosuccinate lyase